MSDISVAIVAVPSNADDLPGPEDKHCTLQYLGKIGDTGAPGLEDSFPALLSAVNQAAASMQPFSLPVERVGPLGNEGAMVWFLEDPDMRMHELKAQAQTPEVVALYEASTCTKHPEFTPHVTIGYKPELASKPEVKDVTEIAFYAIALWWGDERIVFPLGALATATAALEHTAELAIIDVHGNWHHPSSGKFIRKPWEFDQTLKVMFPQEVTAKIDEITGSPKGSGAEDIYRLRKNLRVLAKDPENEGLIDAAWAKVADLRERYSLAAVKNMSGGSGRGEPLEGLPTMDSVDAVLELVEEGLEFLETAWMYENVGLDDTEGAQMLPLPPVEWDDETPRSYSLETFTAISELVHRVRRSDDVTALVPRTSTLFAAVRKPAISGAKLNTVVGALESLGDTEGARSAKNLAGKGNKAGLNQLVDEKVKTLEKVAKSLETFVNTDPSEYDNPFRSGGPGGNAPRKKPDISDAERKKAAEKGAETRKRNGTDQKRAPAGSADGTGGEWVDDPQTAARAAGGATSGKFIEDALKAGQVTKAQRAAERYLTKVNSALDKLYTITFAAGTTVLASGAIQEAAMPETMLAKWEGPLGFEGQLTGDNRMIAPGALDWAAESFPQPMRWAAEDIGAHDGARVIGTIDGMSRLDEPMEWSGKVLPAGTIFGWGTFDLGSELGMEAQRQVVKQLSNGVSLDLDRVSAEMLDVATAQGELGLALDDAIEDKPVTLIRGARNRAATLVALPAFEGARITAVAEWTHQGGIASKADRLRATLTSLASNNLTAFAGIKIDAGGRWGVAVPKVGYRWVDMPDVAMDRLQDLVSNDTQIRDEVKEESLRLTREYAAEIKTGLEARTPGSIERAQRNAQEVLDNFPFEDYDDDIVPGYDDVDGKPITGEKIRHALEGFVGQDPDDIVEALNERDAGDTDSEEHAADEPADGAEDAPAGGEADLRAQRAEAKKRLDAAETQDEVDAAQAEMDAIDEQLTQGVDEPANTTDSPEQQQVARDIANTSGSKGAALNPFMTQDDKQLQDNLEILAEDLAEAQKALKKSSTPENTRAVTEIVKQQAALRAEIERRKNEGAAPVDEPAAEGPKSGRGPNGRVRNFDAMNDDKFEAEAKKVEDENNDPEALAAVKKSRMMRAQAQAQEASNEDLMKAAYDRTMDFWLKKAMLEERDQRDREARNPAGFTPPDVIPGDEVKTPAGTLGSGTPVVLTSVEPQPDGSVIYRAVDSKGRNTIWALPKSDDSLNRVDTLEVVTAQERPADYDGSVPTPGPVDGDGDGEVEDAGPVEGSRDLLQGETSGGRGMGPGSSPEGDSEPPWAGLVYDVEDLMDELDTSDLVPPSASGQLQRGINEAIERNEGPAAVASAIDAWMADYEDRVPSNVAQALKDLADQLNDAQESYSVDDSAIAAFNWVEDTGGLPKYIREIADALIKKGMTESRAIATAVNTVKRWARGGSAAKGQGGHVSAGTVAKAAAALAEWEAKRAAAHATAVAGETLAVDTEAVELVARRHLANPKRVTTEEKQTAEAATEHRPEPPTPDTTPKLAATPGETMDPEFDRRSLVASGAGDHLRLAAPIKPPSSWFADPKFHGPQPLTVTKEGRVYGHLALWGTCHTGIDGTCLTVPRSASGYSLFHLGVVECEDGTEVPVGRLAMNTGHANDTFGSRKAIAHYENTGLAIADLRAGEDAHGVWVAGALRPDATPEQVRALKASPLSGDWRHNPATNSLDLVMALAVNQPGFTVPRPKFLVASGAVRTLTAAGMVAPAKVSKITVQRALAGDEAAAADIRYLQKLAADARRAEAAQLKVKVLESTGARRRIQEMAASLALTKEES